MSKQFIKCAIGCHEYENIQTIENKNVYNHLTAYTYVCRCKHCGKIKHYVVPVTI